MGNTAHRGTVSPILLPLSTSIGETKIRRSGPRIHLAAEVASAALCFVYVSLSCWAVDGTCHGSVDWIVGDGELTFGMRDGK